MIEGRTASRLAWSIVGLTAVILVAALVFLILGLGTPFPSRRSVSRGGG